MLWIMDCMLIVNISKNIEDLSNSKMIHVLKSEIEEINAFRNLREESIIHCV